MFPREDGVTGLYNTPITPLKAQRLYALSSLQSTGSNNGDVPRRGIEKHFHQTMQNSKVRLLQDFPTYYDVCLPVRENFFALPPLKLCDLPYWTNEDDLRKLVADLERPNEDRRWVRYLVAPSRSGKTASVLPAFLKSAEKENGLKHYFYLAFNNNNGWNFKFKDEFLANDKVSAERQGALFMFESLKLLFNANKAEHYLDLAGLPLRSFNNTVTEMTDYINDLIPGDEKILFHIDEHRQMCDLDTVQAAAFRRGAMSALSRIPRVTVVASFTGVPYEIPEQISSKVCRYPMALPKLEIDKLMMAVKELNFLARPDLAKFSAEEERLWGSLRFRLALLLSSGARQDILLLTIQNHLLGQSTGLDTSFLNEFYGKFTDTSLSTTEALKECIGLSTFPPIVESKNNLNALKLLLGVEDTNEIARQGKDLVLVRFGKIKQITASLWSLLESYDPNHPVYIDGRDRVIQVLTRQMSKGQTQFEYDILSAAPLEAAYAWVLSCKSAEQGRLNFLNVRFKIRCESLEAGRIFQGKKTSSYDFSGLKPNVIYYAEEEEAKHSHPYCDVFFRASDDKVAMIEITGSVDAGKIERKENNLRTWIQSEQSKPENSQYEFYGVVLAPFATGESTTKDKVTVLRGLDAQVLLGGLWQIAEWWKSENEASLDFFPPKPGTADNPVSYSSYTVVQLKEICRHRGLPRSAKLKQDYVDRLTEFDKEFHASGGAGAV